MTEVRAYRTENGYPLATPSWGKMQGKERSWAGSIELLLDLELTIQPFRSELSLYANIQKDQSW